MKQAIPLYLIAFLLLSINPLTAQNLTFEPSNPIPGEKVVIKYNPLGTDLAKVESIEAVCYEFSEDGPKATEVYLQIKDNAYSGTIVVSENAKAVFISLSSDDKKDNNGGEGYGFMIYQKDKETPQPGASASMASAYGSYYPIIGIERDFEKALGYYQKEFSLNPDLKKESKYLKNYSFYAAKAKDEKVLEECKAMIKTMRENVDGEEDMMTISSLYSNTGDKEAANEIKAKILEEYPDGKTAQSKMLNSFYRAKSLDEKLEIYNTLNEKFKDSKSVSASMDQINGMVAMEYGKLNDWENFNKYFALMSNPTSKAGSLNSLAWTMSGESIDAKPEHSAKGRELSKQSLKLLEAEMVSGSTKPNTRTKNQWKKQLEYSYGMYADTYALCAYHEGDSKDAFKYQAIACEANSFGDGEMTERYCIYLEKAKGKEAVEVELQKLISQGNATAKMKEQYKSIYMENTLETAYSKNMAFLQSMSDEKKMNELKAKMIMNKAPDFALVNLKGDKVSLSDLKGKVVVLDFWATWCGPCKASFPGMQTAVEKYKDNDDVAFLFIDTWERGENKKENAQKFIDGKGYTFNVLMDNENEIVANFKVSGIPTKFIVDKNGNIRFKSTGFGGNNDELVSELSMMIEMANEASSSEKTMP